MRAPLLLSLWCSALFCAAFCAAEAFAADVRAPLEPFAGSELIASDFRADDEFDLQTSTFKDYSLTTKKRLYAQPPLHLRGAHRTLWYQANGYATAAEVMHHYREQLGLHGFEVLYDSSADASAKKTWSNGFLTAYEASSELSAKGRWAFNGADSQSVRTLTARRDHVYVSLVAVEWPEDVGAYEAKRGAYVALDVIEGGTRGADGASELARALANAGHVALYDVAFDADRPRSVARIAQLLQAEPNLQLHVVVHTDNRDTLEASLALSKKRAHAIVEALKHAGIAAARITGEGVGPLAPLTSNATEEGRSQNRRVELVAR